MQLTMERLLNQLKQFRPQWDGTGVDLISISSICFFTKNTRYNSNEILYIGHASDLLPEFSFEIEIPIVCIEDIPIPEQYLVQKAVLRLPSKTDLHAVYNSIVELLKEGDTEKEFMEALYRSILRDDDIQKICDLAKEFLHNPIVVLDNSLKHIAESSETKVKAAIWIDQRKNGSYISTDYVQVLAEQAGYKKDHYSTSPVLLPKGKLKYRRIISHIFLNHHPIGTIVIFEVQRNIQEVDLKIAKMLSEVLTLKMKNDEFLLYSKGVVYEHLFQDLLDETITSSVLYERIKSHHLTIEEDIYVLAVDISEFDRTYKTLQYFRSVMDEIIEKGKSILYNNYIVIVVMCKDGIYLSGNEISKMNTFCKEKKLSAGISRCFHDISMLKTHFEQAITALNLNYRINKECRLSSYVEFTTEHMITIASEKTDLIQFCEEGLLKLMKYDASNHMNLAECLHEFLVQERNLAHTALALHMHRNTLIYRVNKIQEIMQHDLDDSNYRFNLLLSFKIIALLKNLDYT
jgi:sugar diacid utilization regulator